MDGGEYFALYPSLYRETVKFSMAVTLDEMDDIPAVVSQYAEEAAFLHGARTSLLVSVITLPDLQACDDRLTAYLDGLAIAGEGGWASCDAQLETPSAGAMFTSAVRAIEDRNQTRIDNLFTLTESAPEIRTGLTSAFGWLDRERLQGIVANFLDVRDSLRRTVGIAACAMHRLDPGLVSARRILDPDPFVRRRALRTAGEIGCLDANPALVAAERDDDVDCRFWAAWSSVLLGNRGRALDSLTGLVTESEGHRPRAFRLALQAVSKDDAHALLRRLAGDPSQLRWLIQGSGIAGDPRYVSWLIDHMHDDKAARLAGESFTLITGADLSAVQLDRPQPENFESGPTDNPEDENVDMDPDEGLPWPDPEKIEKWWAANSSRFHKGTRYFMGAPVTREHCIDVLKNGYQRQRILAAHYLCLLHPGTPLFNTSAPAWRQQRLLARM